MKNGFLSSFAILTLASFFSFNVFSIGVTAQTTNDGPGPTEQPSAPMEIGTPQAQGQPMQSQQMQGQPIQDQPMQPPPPDIQGNAQGGGQGYDMQPSDSQPSDQPAEAQPGGPSGEAPAQTDLGVGRISLIHGNVSTQRGDSGDWSAATLNQPVMGGDKVSTGDGGRTEVQLDFANILRLGTNSKAILATFTHKDIQIQLAQGIANYSVTKDSDAEPEIDTPNVAVHPAHQNGVFRIEVRPDGDTIVIVHKGDVQIATPQGSTEVRQGEMATIRGDASSAQYKIDQAPAPDDWDRWNADRDYMIRNAQSWRHTNHYYTGAQDLDAYGNWQNVPDYGDVWVPNQSAGWAPYRDGNWTYEPYYGWTWVGYEPWGWAPYHYGRWMWWNNAWAWWPGVASAVFRPFWSPAYVAFWGLRAALGLGFGSGGWGGFGWLPIGPGDWFHPWWGGYAGRFGWVGHGGFDRFGGFAPLHGGTRFSNVANFHDAHIGGALSTVRAGQFGAGRVSAVATTREQIGGARMMAGNLPVTPTRASLSASGRSAAADTMRGGSQHFFASAHSNAAHPESFAQQTARLRQTMAQNHVNGFTAGSRGEFARGRVSGTMSRPSAGTPSNRESGNFGNRGASSMEGANRGGMRPFTPPNSGNSRSFSGTQERSGQSYSGYSGSRNSGYSGNSGNRDGFRPFTPPSHSEASRGEAGSPYGNSQRGSYQSGERGGNGGYWNRTSPGESAHGGSYSQGYNRGSEGYNRGSSGSEAYNRGSSGSRPQLDMRQPIVRSPSYGGGYSRGGYGGYGESRPGYGGSRSNDSRPNYGGYGGGGYGGGSHGAPSYGGRSPSFGGSHGGGGHMSAPHSSGGGHFGGGHSGGSHSGGGGHSGGHGGGGHGGHR